MSLSYLSWSRCLQWSQLDLASLTTQSVPQPADGSLPWTCEALKTIIMIANAITITITITITMGTQSIPQPADGSLPWTCEALRMKKKNYHGHLCVPHNPIEHTDVPGTMSIISSNTYLCFFKVHPLLLPHGLPCFCWVCFHQLHRDLYQTSQDHWCGNYCIKPDYIMWWTCSKLHQARMNFKLRIDYYKDKYTMNQNAKMN